MKEKEMKFGVKSFTKVKERLDAIGAKLIWKGMEETQYYDFRDESLRARGISLRIRDWRNHSISITCKRDLQDSTRAKNRDEFQFIVTDKKQVEGFLNCLDLVPKFFYKKRREHWEVNKNTHVELDELETGQKFVEIEGSERSIARLSKVLDVYDCPRLFKSYPEILTFTKSS